MQSPAVRDEQRLSVIDRLTDGRVFSCVLVFLLAATALAGRAVGNSSADPQIVEATAGEPTTKTDPARPPPTPLISPAPSSSTTPRSGSTGTATWALDLLQELEVSDAAPPVRYDRDDYDGWQDVDGDCQSARHETLISESVQAVSYTNESECKVALGSWIDPYSGATISEAADASIDHVVSLAESHRAGAWAWPPEWKRALFNDISDPATLAVSATDVNGAKGSFGPHEWLPDAPDARCSYLVARVRVKTRWQLSLSPQEQQALHTGLTICVEQQLPAVPEAAPLQIIDFSTTAPIPHAAAPPAITPGTCDARYQNTCIPISAGDLDCADITARDFDAAGSDPHNFDGNNNGQGCEVLDN